MSTANPPVEQRRESVTTFSLTDHVESRLRYDSDKRCINKKIISEAIQYGDREDNPHGPSDTAIRYRTDGIVFLVAVDTLKRNVVTAYPIKFHKNAAHNSCRWTLNQLRSVKERVEEGKTELI